MGGRGGGGFINQTNDENETRKPVLKIGPAFVLCLMNKLGNAWGKG